MTTTGKFSIYLAIIIFSADLLILQQGKIAEAQKAVAALYGKERVPEVINDLRASVQGSSEPEAGWFDLFSSRYRKGMSRNSEPHPLSLTSI